MSVRPYLINFHFILACLSVLNILTWQIFRFGWVPIWSNSVLIAVYLSGSVLFFWFVKPFKWISVYYGIYISTFIITIIGLIIKGLGSAIIIMILLLPFRLEPLVVKDDGLMIYGASGFLGPCCRYRITENKGLVFEREIDVFDLDRSLDMDGVRMVRHAKTVDLIFVVESFPVDSMAVPKDTTITFYK